MRSGATWPPEYGDTVKAIADDSVKNQREGDQRPERADRGPAADDAGGRNRNRVRRRLAFSSALKGRRIRPRACPQQLRG